MRTGTIYFAEVTHQKRVLTALLLAVIAFALGDRLERAILVEDAAAAQPSAAAAYAALAPTPVVLSPAAAPVRARRAAADRDADAGTADAATDPTPLAGLEDAGEPQAPQQVVLAPAAAIPVAPPVIASEGQFDSSERAIFGLPTGLVPTAAGPAGDPGAVPEPESWAYLIMGVGVVGVMLRRRRRAGSEVQALGAGALAA